MSARAAVWVDSHCHLDFADFLADGVQNVLDRARLNRVGYYLTISTHTQRLSKYVALADAHPNVWTTVGVHPHQAAEADETNVSTADLIALARSHAKIVGIGECGLDYHYDNIPHEAQHRVFCAHIEAAIATGLPLIIHAREADADMMRILNEAGAGRDPALKAVLHCFSSSRQLADFALDCGFYISFSGIVTFPKSLTVQEICKAVPLEKLLVETDAPYLAPVPYRGKRNEPAFVSHTGRFVAALHGIDENVMAKQTTDNFFRLFDKIKRPVHE